MSNSSVYQPHGATGLSSWGISDAYTKLRDIFSKFVAKHIIGPPEANPEDDIPILLGEKIDRLARKTNLPEVVILHHIGRREGWPSMDEAKLLERIHDLMENVDEDVIAQELFEVKKVLNADPNSDFRHF